MLLRKWCSGNVAVSVLRKVAWLNFLLWTSEPGHCTTCIAGSKLSRPVNNAYALVFLKLILPGGGVRAACLLKSSSEPWLYFSCISEFVWVSDNMCLE